MNTRHAKNSPTHDAAAVIRSHCKRKTIRATIREGSRNGIPAIFVENASRPLELAEWLRSGFGRRTEFNIYLTSGRADIRITP
jgi:hypothetical protein